MKKIYWKISFLVVLVISIMIMAIMADKGIVVLNQESQNYSFKLSVR